MDNTYKTKQHLLKELENMRQQVAEIERCKDEFQKVQSKYEKLLDAAPDALIFVNNKGRVVMGNARFENVFGYSHDEINGKALDILIPERFRTKHI